MHDSLSRLQKVRSHFGLDIVLNVATAQHSQELLTTDSVCLCMMFDSDMSCVAPCCCKTTCRSANTVCHAQQQPRKHACNAGKDVEADKKQKIQILAILVRISGLTGNASVLSSLSMSPIQRMSPICLACNISKQALSHMWRI